MDNTQFVALEALLKKILSSLQDLVILLKDRKGSK